MPVANTLDADWIVAKAKQLGFDLCGIAPAERLADSAFLDQWLERGFAGEMRYLHDPRRADPSLVLPGARSVIVCALLYGQGQPYSIEAAAEAAAGGQARGWMARYAWGDDYHVVLGERLDVLLAALRERFGADFSARAYVDTGPISERAAAKLAGLGWIGKNTCLINQESGSWFFLGAIVTSLAPDASAELMPAPDLCGNCRLCLDACPTGALVEPYVMDARRCISYLTIELRGTIPEEHRTAIGWQVFGCDICQDVCPWNDSARTFAAAAKQESPADPLAPRAGLVAPELLWLLSLTEQEFREKFRGSSVKRTKWRGLLRNACVVAGNALANLRSREQVQAAAALCARLEELAASEDEVIAEHGRWALAPLQARGLFPQVRQD